MIIFLFAAVLCSLAQVKVTTYHYDNSRSGQNVNETILRPAVVNQNSFGKLFSQSVDGQVYAEPLYLPNVVVGSQGTHNIVYVVTEHDSVFAFDADSNQGPNARPLWHVSFINAAQKISSIPSTDTGTALISPEIGITSTPVIDSRTGTLYVVAATKEKGKYFQRLHALDVSSGAEKFGGPVVIQASVPGTGWASKDGKVFFDPLRNLQRAALLLVQGVVYIAWSSHGLEDQFPYHGWVVGYSENTLAQVSAHCVTPNGKQGGIWQAGSGLASDSLGNVYYIAGNGSFDANTAGPDYGESYVKLSMTGGLKVADYFTPFDQATLSDQDRDLGSGGIVLLPVQSGTGHPNLAIGAGKNGTIYLVDRNNMGQFNASGNSQIVQSITSAFNGHAMFNTPAYWQQQLYFWADHDVLRIFGITAGKLTTTPNAVSSVSFTLGASPVITSDGSNNGLVWVVQSDSAKTGGAAVLHALDATTALELYNSGLAGVRDVAGPAVKFSTPTVANGKVYVGTTNQLDVYGLF